MKCEIYSCTLEPCIMDSLGHQLGAKNVSPEITLHLKWSVKVKPCYLISCSTEKIHSLLLFCKLVNFFPWTQSCNDAGFPTSFIWLDPAAFLPNFVMRFLLNRFKWNGEKLNFSLFHNLIAMWELRFLRLWVHKTKPPELYFTKIYWLKVLSP